MMDSFLPNDDKLDINAFAKLLAPRYLTNSYKIYWLYAILEEVRRGNGNIKFQKLISWMVAKCWYSILKFKLNFGKQDFLYKIVQYIYLESGLNERALPEEIINFISNSNDKRLHKLIEHFYKFVPNRLLSPFYINELKNIPEDKRSIFLIEQSQMNSKFYRIDQNDKSITINKDWLEYIKVNSQIIEGWILSKLVTYLQNRNPSVPAIINKIFPPQTRNLSAATNFWKKINEISRLKEIYTSKYLNMETFSLDHFIPWSFVLHDQIWNLIPVTKSINSSKNDRLPNLSRFLDPFLEIQYHAFNISLNYNIKSKIIENYLDLKGVELVKTFPETKFKLILEETIKPLYQLAINQGFEIWII